MQTITIQNEEAKQMTDKKKDDKKEAKVIKSIGSCKDFKDLQAFLKKSGKEKITNSLDLAMLKPQTYDDLLKLMTKERERLSANEFKTKSRIKAHIKFREAHNNWIFSKEEDTVQLIGKE